jgi:hypothetical protein
MMLNNKINLLNIDIPYTNAIAQKAGQAANEAK